MKTATYFLLTLIISLVFSSCDQVNPDSETPVIDVAPVHYFQKNTQAIVGIFNDDIDFSNAEVQFSSEALELADGVNIENGVWLRYSPGELSSEMININFYENNNLLASTSIEMREFTNTECIRSGFSESFTYSHSQYQANEDKSLVIDLIENDAVCGIDWNSSVIFIFARGNSLGLSSIDELQRNIYTISISDIVTATYTFEPNPDFEGAFTSYYSLAVVTYENINRIYPEKDLSGCAPWSSCLSDEEELVLVNRIHDDYRGEFASLYTNASIEITVTE